MKPKKPINLYEWENWHQDQFNAWYDEQFVPSEEFKANFMLRLAQQLFDVYDSSGTMNEMFLKKATEFLKDNK